MRDAVCGLVLFAQKMQKKVCEYLENTNIFHTFAISNKVEGFTERKEEKSRAGRTGKLIN